MAFVTFNFAAGLNKDDTPLASEGGYVDGDKVRFSQGRAQTIGGWDLMTLDTFSGIARGAHVWADLAGTRYLAFGTAAKLNAVIGGQIKDITPPHSEGVLTNPFKTVSGSAVVTVTHPDHGFPTGTPVTFANATAAVGGLTIAGIYPITVLDGNTYTIAASSNASSSATMAGRVDYSAPLMPGLVDGLGEPGGYGSGAYGMGGYGTTLIEESLPRVWFLCGWGETLLALPRGGGLYQYQPASAYPELMANGDFTSSFGWTLGTGWTVASGAANASAGTVSALSTGVAVKPGFVYRLALNATVSAGTIAITTDGGDLGAASAPIAVTGSYSRRFRAPFGSTRIVITKDAAFAGSIDAISLTLESLAYRIDEAPHRSAAMFVDSHQIAVLLGTVLPEGLYEAMGVRWCDRQDISAWTALDTNLAGDDILSQGSRIVSGLPTRQQNLIWSDSTLFTMQFTGDASAPFLFHPVGSGCGLIGALARDEHDGIVYWASRDNFYRYAGAAPEPIRCTLRRDVFDNISPNQGEKMVCGVLPGYSEVWFFYPDARDGNECSRYAAIRWDEGHSTAGMFNRSAWVKSGVYDFPIAFGTDGKIYYHEKGDSAVGGVLPWFVETGFFDVGDGEQLSFLRRIVGDFEDLKGGVLVTVYGRLWSTSVARAHGPYQHTNVTKKLDMRVTARQIKLRFEGASSPAFARFGALRLDLMPSGAKR